MLGVKGGYAIKRVSGKKIHNNREGTIVAQKP
jgi:hypothetical protein